MNRKAQISLGLFLGFENDHDFFTGIDWEDVPESERVPGIPVSREEILSFAENGKTIFEYPETLRNIDKIISLVKEKGDRISDSDLCQGLNMAAQKGAVQRLFAPENWVGHSDEMESLWYRIDRNKRGDFDFENARRMVARMEGRKLREDQLAEMGITKAEMLQAIKMGDLHTLKEKLERGNDHVRIEDIQMLDIDGNHALNTALSWVNFDRTCQELRKHGEVLDAEFFLFRRAGKPSIVESAFNANQERKVFGTMVFKGRPEECEKLYNTLTDQQKAKVNLAQILPDVIEKTYADTAGIDDTLSVEGLTKSLYEPSANRPDRQPLFYLGMPKFMHQIDKVNECLKQKGEKITLEMLRKPYGFSSESCLFRAAAFGVFDKVMEILEENGEKIELDDLMKQDTSGNHIIKILSQRNQLSTILKPEIWAGRTKSLTLIWNTLPLSEQAANRVAFSTAQTRANQLSLRALKR